MTPTLIAFGMTLSPLRATPGTHREYPRTSVLATPCPGVERPPRSSVESGAPGTTLPFPPRGAADWSPGRTGGPAAQAPAPIEGVSFRPHSVRGQEDSRGAGSG